MMNEYNQRMVEAMQSELRKIRNYPRFRYYGFALPHEIEDIRARLRMANMQFRTEKIVKENKLVGWKVLVRE